MTMPPLIMWSGNAADFHTYLDNVYNVFITDFIQKGHVFLGKPVKARYNPSYDNKHFSFWHVISEEGDSPAEDDRIPDLERCKRIAWIGHILSTSNNPEILCWKNRRTGKRGGEDRYLLYVPEERYLVILSEKQNCFFLVTAYIVKYENAHNRLLREHAGADDPRSK